MNLYEVLGVNKNASLHDIKTAYRILARNNHPDLSPGDTEKEETFKQVAEAYGVLGNKSKRARYDATGEMEALKPIDIEVNKKILRTFEDMLLENDVADIDYPVMMEGQFREDVRALAVTKISVKLMMRKLERLKEKFIVKHGEDNVFIDGLDKQISDFELSIEMINHKAEVLTLARKVIARHCMKPQASPMMQYLRHGIHPEGM